MFDPVPCGTMVVLIKRAQSQAKKKTREEKCIQKLFLLLDGIRFIQEVKEGPSHDPPILWINANKYVYCKQFLRQFVLFVSVIGHLGLKAQGA